MESNDNSEVKDKIAKFAEKSIFDLNLNESELTYLLEHPYDFQGDLKNFIKNFSLRHKYASEEYPSERSYASCYNPVNLNEQIETVLNLFPDIACDLKYINKIVSEYQFPIHAEGFFATPRWQAVGSTYEESLIKVLELLKNKYTELNYLFTNNVSYRKIRQNSKTEYILNKLFEEQGYSDILIFPAQLGIYHRGRSMRRACSLFEENECSIDPFTAGIILLTNPNRLVSKNDLIIDCPGEVFDEEKMTTCKSTEFCIGDFSLDFGICDFKSAFKTSGTASMFLPVRK